MATHQLKINFKDLDIFDTTMFSTMTENKMKYIILPGTYKVGQMILYTGSPSGNQCMSTTHKRVGIPV